MAKITYRPDIRPDGAPYDATLVLTCDDPDQLSRFQSRFAHNRTVVFTRLDAAADPAAPAQPGFLAVQIGSDPKGPPCHALRMGDCVIAVFQESRAAANSVLELEAMAKAAGMPCTVLRGHGEGVAFATGPSQAVLDGTLGYCEAFGAKAYATMALTTAHPPTVHPPMQIPMAGGLWTGEEVSALQRKVENLPSDIHKPWTPPQYQAALLQSELLRSVHGLDEIGMFVESGISRAIGLDRDTALRQAAGEAVDEPPPVMPHGVRGPLPPDEPLRPDTRGANSKGHRVQMDTYERGPGRAMDSTVLRADLRPRAILAGMHEGTGGNPTVVLTLEFDGEYAHRDMQRLLDAVPSYALNLRVRPDPNNATDRSPRAIVEIGNPYTGGAVDDAHAIAGCALVRGALVSQADNAALQAVAQALGWQGSASSSEGSLCLGPDVAAIQRAVLQVVEKDLRAGVSADEAAGRRTIETAAIRDIAAIRGVVDLSSPSASGERPHLPGDGWPQSPPDSPCPSPRTRDTRSDGSGNSHADSLGPSSSVGTGLVRSPRFSLPPPAPTSAAAPASAGRPPAQIHL